MEVELELASHSTWSDARLFVEKESIAFEAVDDEIIESEVYCEIDSWYPLVLIESRDFTSKVCRALSSSDVGFDSDVELLIFLDW